MGPIKDIEQTMKVPFVNLSTQYQQHKEEILGMVEKLIGESNYIGGRAVIEFSKAFSAYHDIGYCIPCGNGTDSLEIILRAMNIGPGDEVLVPDLTWISTAEVVSLVGATPVFVDVHPEYYTIDISGIRKKITSRTKAIMPVHLYGNPCDMDAINNIAADNDLKVIEDCAQAHGASYNGKKVGTMGHAGSFSFYPSKNLGAFGDAGAIITDNEELAERCRWISNHGQPEKNTHLLIGRNSRMDTIQAGILNIKLKYLDSWNEKRKAHALQYNSQLQEAPIKLPAVATGSSHVYHLYVIATDRRDELKDYLASKQIGTAIHYPNPLHLTQAYSDFLKSPDLEVAKGKTKRILSLPMFPELSNDQITYVCDMIKDFFNNEKR